MPSSRLLTVVVADDQPLFRAGLARAISHHPQLRIVAQTGNGRDAIDAIREQRPALALLALDLPGLDGLSLLGAVRRERLDTAVLLVATAIGEHDLRRSRALAVAGLVSRRATGEEMLGWLLAVGRGEQVTDERIAAAADLDRRFARDDGSRPLTAREREVLGLMAEGLSGPQIAKALIVSPSTVKSHIENLYEKLGVSQRGAAVAEGMRRGLLG